MAARFIRLLSSNGEEMYVRPEAIMAFGIGSGFPHTSWIILWGTSYEFHINIRETCQEIATLLTNGGT